jgi:hypothetical protein
LELVSSDGISAVAKLNGRILTILVTQGNSLKLVRTLELTDTTVEDIAADLYPTFVYIEDRFAAKASRLMLCGFGLLEETALRQFEAELEVPVEAVRSAMGAISANNAGLLGYLQGARAA